MRPEEDLLYRIPAKSPRLLLERLSDLARRREEGEDLVLPQIVLHLPGGRNLTGMVLRIENTGPQGEVLLFHVPDDPRQPRFHLAYLDPRQVEGITVLNADQQAHWIGFGAIPEPEPKTAAPGKLELARLLADLSRSLAAEAGWTVAAEMEDDVPQADAGRRNLQELIRQGLAVLQEMAEDSFAREAHKEQIHGVRFGQASEPGIALSDGVLRILADLSKGYEGRLRKAELRAVIAKHL